MDIANTVGRKAHPISAGVPITFYKLDRASSAGRMDRACRAWVQAQSGYAARLRISGRRIHFDRMTTRARRGSKMYGRNRRPYIFFLAAFLAVFFAVFLPFFAFLAGFAAGVAA